MERDPIPEGAAARFLAPLTRFLQVEAAGGIFLLIATAAALATANSPWAGHLDALLRVPCELRVGPLGLRKDLLHVINDGLMTIFFFVVGLEIKRELVTGELREPRKAILPVVAALGGMVAPALLYLALVALLPTGEGAARGWAVPMATDIAFVVGIMALLGPRVAPALKVLLLSLAIVDDLGAVLIIALVFTDHVDRMALVLAAGGFALIGLCNRLGVRRVGIYVFLGAGIWLAVLRSGVHPTAAGVLLGLLTPASAWVGDRALLEVIADLYGRLRGGVEIAPEELGRVGSASREAVPPLERLEEVLHPWVAFVIMPLFALANAGVPLRSAALGDPLALAVALGLAAGKPLGVLSFCWISVRLGLARLPEGVGWRALAGGACLAGIGFTMALFLAALALPEAGLAAGKIGTLLGSLASAVLGIALLRRGPRRSPS